MAEVENDIELKELLPWIEFGCWTAIVLFPFLYWVNGPAVSIDQYVMRNILIGVALIGAFGLRYWNWRTTKRCAESVSSAEAEVSMNDSGARD
jgi:hypothetical protein